VTMGTGVARLNALYSDNVPLAVARERCGATDGGDARCSVKTLQL